MQTNSMRKRYEEFLLKPVMDGITIKEGKGVQLIDAQGKEYLDFTSGFGVSLLGYNNQYTQYVDAAVQRQMRRIVHVPHYLYYSEPAIALAEKLAEISPGALKKTFFCNSGSEAVEGGIRTARKYRRKFELLGLQQGFMGHTMGAVSLTGRSKYKKGIGPLLPGVHHIPAPYCLRCSLGHTFPGCNLACADYVEDFIKFGTQGEVAGLIIEPIMGHAGVVVPPDGYFTRMDAICRRHGISIVADETITGIGKTGKMFAVEHWGLEPEIITLGKAIGGGFPLGAFIVSDDVAAGFEFDDASSALGGNPIACTASLATIELIEKEALCQKAAVLGDYLIKELRNLAGTFEAIGEVRGKGLFVGIEIVDQDNHAPAPRMSQRIKRKMLDGGFLLTHYGESTLRLTPPLIIEQNHIDQFVETLSAVLKT